ncbi:hypothetical protein JAAARDRAFT_42119 [Jaapia argillacea MUCL 33604]|uniref:DUF6533 domain-containing protein n=1 Tax=Jaapia argillacea MUCL 33604 TaxID=933084 RepID=A0A067P9I8_9AGAM|nr:hypothetical protein JAAARDRAFT_42119 [Jaapia argillacea MUCL 33604]
MAQPTGSAHPTALVVEAAQMITYSSVSSFAFLMWDVCLTLDDEVEYIWRQEWSSPAKSLFLFTRYFSVVAQAILLIPRADFPERLPSHHRSCRTWFIFKSVTYQSLISSVGLILMLRVYAPYDRAVWVLSILRTLFAVQMILALPVYFSLFPLVELDDMYEPRKSPMSQLSLHLLRSAAQPVLAGYLILSRV